MDFTLGILLGLSTGSFGFALGLGIKNFTIPRLKQHFFDLINAYVAGFMKNVQDNPEVAEQFVGPFIQAALKEFQNQTQAPGETKGAFKIAGLKIPNSILQPIIERVVSQFIGKKQNSNSLLELPS